MSDRTIFRALSAVQTALAEKGISKDQTNSFDNYKFRGIDDVLNAMAPILSANGVLILPSVTETDTRQVPTQKGGVQNHSKVKVDYTLYDEHGDSITHKIVGEAMDRGDKSINKAMSAAYKYFLFQAFCIPLQGQDADAESHEIAPAYTEEQKAELLRLMAAKDGIGIRIFYQSVGQEVMDALFNCAEQGKKTAFKQEIRDLYAEGNKQIKATVGAIQESLSENQADSVAEILAELTADERKLVDAALSEVELHQINEIERAAA